MKKIVILIMFVVSLTGCNKTIKCTKVSEEGIDTNEVLKVTFKNDKVIKINQKIDMTFIDEYKQSFNSTYKSLKKEYDKLGKKDGYKVKLKKDDEDSIINISVKINLKKSENKNTNILDTNLSKKDLINNRETMGYICK